MIEDTLAERNSQYGDFDPQAKISQEFKILMQGTPNWEKLYADQAEALDMIAHKIARILNGDPNYADSWHDIAGYAKLVDDRLSAKTESPEIPDFLRRQDPAVDRRGPHHPGKVDTKERRRLTD